MITTAPPESEGPRICGAAVISALTFIKKKMPPGSLERILAQLDEKDRVELSEIVSAIHWYPLATYQRFLDGASALSGAPNFREQLGTFGAEQEINTIYKFILRFATPYWFIDRGMRLWSRYHNSGVWKIEGRERTIRGTLTGFAMPHPGVCRVFGAWFVYAAKLTGAPKAAIAHPECRVNGANACVFVMEW